MSHVTIAEGRIGQTDLDLQAVRLACEELGLEFCEGVTTYKWYGRWVNDYHATEAAYHQIDPKTFGTCKHMIRIKGNPNAYQLGLVELENGMLAPVFDQWGSGLSLQSIIGPASKKFVSVVNRYKAVLTAAAQQGHTVKSVERIEGTTKVRVIIGVKVQPKPGSSLGGSLK